MSPLGRGLCLGTRASWRSELSPGLLKGTWVHDRAGCTDHGGLVPAPSVAGLEPASLERLAGVKMGFRVPGPCIGLLHPFTMGWELGIIAELRLCPICRGAELRVPPCWPVVSVATSGSISAGWLLCPPKSWGDKSPTVSWERRASSLLATQPAASSAGLRAQRGAAGAAGGQLQGS